MISFQEKYPTYAKKWDFEKNEKLPSEVSYGSGTKYWWKCEKGHSWLSSPNVMSRGTECPYCSGLLPVIGETDLTTTHPEVLKIWNYVENDKSRIKPYEVKAGSKTKAYWLCEKGHTWIAPIQRITIEKSGCPYCANQKVLAGFNDLETIHPELLEEWDYEKNEIKPNEVLSGSTKKVWWKCKYCGKSWKTAIIHRTGKRETGCPNCAPKLNRENQLKNQIMKEGSLADKYPQLLKEWNYEKNNISPDKVVSKSAKKVYWKCEKGHEWEAIIASRTRKHGTGCPICAGKKVLEGFNDLKSQKPILVKEWDYKKNNSINMYPEKITSHSEKKVYWICPICGTSYKAAICHRVNGTACPQCANELKTSFGEQAIYYYLSKLFPFCENRKDVIGYEADIMINELNLAIEYDGEYYHNNKKSEEKEKEKYEMFKKISIILIRIKENFQNNAINSNADYTIEIKSKNYEKEIPIVIKEIIDYINDRYGYDYEINIDIKRDRQYIYEQYVFRKKENSIEYKRKDLLNEWDYEKNKIKPCSVSLTSGKKVWWKCKNGHSYEQNVSNHVKGSRCPYCSNVKVLSGFNDLETRYPNIAKKWDYEKNKKKPSQILPFTNKKYFWICSNGHSFEATSNSMCNKKNPVKCPICNGKKVLAGYNDFATLQPELLKEWNFNKNKKYKPSEVTEKSKNKVWWICPLGHEYKAAIQQRTRYNKTKCPICNGKKVLKGYNDLASQKPELLEEWDYKKNTIMPDEIHVRSETRVWWKCKECGNEWKTSLYCRAGQGKGCIICSRKRFGQKERERLVLKQGSLEENCPELLKEWDYSKNVLLPNEVTIGSHKRVYWICSNCGHKWSTEIRVRAKRKNGCPKCSKKK